MSSQKRFFSMFFRHLENIISISIPIDRFFFCIGYKLNTKFKVVFVSSFLARACLNNICPNLHPPHLYEGHCHAKAFCTADVKDVINCIGGGVHVIFPLLESAFSEIGKHHYYKQ